MAMFIVKIIEAALQNDTKNLIIIALLKISQICTNFQTSKNVWGINESKYS